MKEKILVFTKNWLGDVIFEEPFIRALKVCFPDSEIHAATAPRCRVILEANPNIDKVLEFDDRKADHSWSAKMRFIKTIRNESYTRTFILHRSFSRALIVRLAGIPYRAGYDTKGRRFLLTHPVRELDAKVHRVDYFLNILSELDLMPVFPDRFYKFYFREEELENVMSQLDALSLPSGKFVVLNPGGNWDKKRWPAESFAALADLLYNKFDLKVVISGSEADELLAGEIIKNVKTASVTSLCGKTSLRESGALFSQAALVISADSGPSHIASGVGAPVIVLFGPTEHLETGPRGNNRSFVISNVPKGCSVPCFNEACHENICMKGITPDRVMQLIKEKNLL